MILPCKGSDPQQILFYEIQKKSSFCFNFRAWSCSENEQRLWTTASLEKAAGWVGRVSAQSGVPGTKDRGLCFPRSSHSTPVLPRLPKCRSARAPAREHKHSHTRTGACAKHPSTAPPNCPSPSVGQPSGSLTGRGRSQGKKCLRPSRFSSTR